MLIQQITLQRISKPPQTWKIQIPQIRIQRIQSPRQIISQRPISQSVDAIQRPQRIISQIIGQSTQIIAQGLGCIIDICVCRRRVP